VSSEFGYVLHSRDLTMLQRILDAAGYSAANSVAHPERYNIAAKLLFERSNMG